MRVFATAGLVVAIGACGPEMSWPDGGDRHTDAPPFQGVGSDANGCEQSVPITTDEVGAPPDVLLVVDKSGSMLENLSNGAQKWSTMRAALIQIVDARQDDVHWGLALFPMSSQCGAGAVLVGCAPDTHAQITSQVNAVTYPDGATPTHTTLQAAGTWYSTHAINPNGRYVLLATDGVPNCGPGGQNDESVDETASAIANLAAMGVKTYVIGFGSGTSVNPGALARFAEMGQTTHYYQANSPQDLTDALEQVTTAVAVPSCTYELDSTPEDVTRLSVSFDGTAVGRTSAHSNGWDYDSGSNSVVFYGSACTELQSGSVSSVGVDYGCGGPVVD